MLRSFLAVLAGFVTMTLVVVLATVFAVRAILRRPLSSLRGETSPPLTPSYLTANLAGTALAAILGGMLTASLAPAHPVIHGVVLGAVMVFMSLMSARQAGARQPRWYQRTLMTVMPLLAVTGSWLVALQQHS